MIDTIRLKIEASPEILRIVRLRAEEFTRIDHATGLVKYRFYKYNASIGSYDNHVNFVDLDDDNFLYIEFSLPKYFFNHNIFLYPPERLSKDLLNVYRDLCSFFRTKKIPDPLWWVFQRIDLCYAWKFYDDPTCLRTLEYLKRHTLGRKTFRPYQTSVMWRGSDSSVKFYMKGPEFYDHDYVKSLKSDPEKAMDLLDYARGILRFEITLRKDAILTAFKLRSNEYDISPLLTRNNIVDIMRAKIKTLLKTTPELMSTQTAYEKIFSNASTPAKRRRALAIYSYWRMSHSADPLDRDLLHTYSRTSRWRYDNWIRRLFLGVPSDLSGSAVSLNIPNVFGVPEFPR